MCNSTRRERERETGLRVKRKKMKEKKCSPLRCTAFFFPLLSLLSLSVSLSSAIAMTSRDFARVSLVLSYVARWSGLSSRFSKGTCEGANGIHYLVVLSNTTRSCRSCRCRSSVGGQRRRWRRRRRLQRRRRRPAGGDGGGRGARGPLRGRGRR